MRMMSVATAMCALLAGCGSSGRDDGGPRGIFASSLAGPPTTDPADLSAYRIGPTDLLKLTVFQVPDLSFDEIRVDSAGALQLPVVGSIQASGKTSLELSRDLEALLGARYLRNPSVSITVVEAASQKVTVDGAVTKAGVYLMRGRTTLMQAVAMAEGPSRTADLSKVAVFRTEGDQRLVALFDLGAIRNGEAADPILRGDDVVVVDTSRLNAAVRAAVESLPALAVFGYLR